MSIPFERNVIVPVGVPSPVEVTLAETVDDPIETDVTVGLGVPSAAGVSSMNANESPFSGVCDPTATHAGED
jgi:hypothetical protein